MSTRKKKISPARPRTTLDWVSDGDSRLWRYIKDYVGRARGRKLKELASLGLAAQDAGMFLDEKGHLSSRAGAISVVTKEAAMPANGSMSPAADKHREAIGRVADSLLNW